MDTRILMQALRTVLAAALFAAVPVAAQAQDVVELKIVARDGRFEPAELVAPVGKRLHIEISNDGKAPIEFESKPLKVEKVIAPGTRAFVTVNPLKAGDYVFVDEFNEKNARGRIIVR